MASTTKCPICGEDAKWTHYGGSHGTEEETIKCECGYYYEFAYGNYCEQKPGEPLMAWSYCDHEKWVVPEEQAMVCDELPF